MNSSLPQPLLILGKTDFHYKEWSREFGIQERDRLQHMYVIGKTGSGKTTLLENMVLQDIRAGKGVAVIDPHGDYVERVVAQIPSDRIKDVVYFNPTDTEFPIAFNPLDPGGNPPHSLIASGIISTLQKIWGRWWGPRMEYILRSALLTLLQTPNSTFLDLHRLMVDKKFREKIVKEIQDPQLAQFWNREFGQYTQRFRTEGVSPILNKVGSLIEVSWMRNILGQRKSALSMRTIMDEGKILLVNVSKGRLGEDNSTLLASLLINSIQLAALSRADIPEEERRNFFVYIDEAQSVSNESLLSFFPEMRKFHCGIVMSHQYLNQLEGGLEKSILGNVGTIILFRLSAHDAKFLESEFSPEFKALDINYLPSYRAYIKMVVGEISSTPFSFMTLPPPTVDFSFREEVIDWSRRQYARPRGKVEKEIMEYFG